jgi:CHAT domain-containing protein/tetratricopeptide (TPR) repeat protein
MRTVLLTIYSFLVLGCHQASSKLPSLALTLQAPVLFPQAGSQSDQTDLLFGLRQADRYVRASAGEAHTFALLQRARVQRIRGEFRSARKDLDEAAASKETSTALHIQIEIERKMLFTERLSTPAGALNMVAKDLSCAFLPGEPTIPIESALLTRKLRSRILQLGAAPTSSRETQRGLRRLLNAAVFDAKRSMSIELLTAFGRSGDSPANSNGWSPPRTLFQSLDGDVQDVTSEDEPWSQRNEGELRLRMALLFPVLQVARLNANLLSPEQNRGYAGWAEHVENIFRQESRAAPAGSGEQTPAWPQGPKDRLPELASCPRSELDQPWAAAPLLAAVQALGCAEAGLFSGGLTEDLGFPTGPVTDSEQELQARALQPSSVAGLWQKHRALALLHPSTAMGWRAASREEALRWLARAQGIAAAHGLTRLSLRAGFVAAADVLAAWLTDPANMLDSPSKTEQARLRAMLAQIDRASRDAQAGGETRMERMLLLYRGLLMTVSGDTQAARASLQRLRTLSQAQDDRGAQLGAARLFASIAVYVTVKRGDLASSERLLEAAVDLYSGAGAVAEGGHPFLRWAEYLRNAGAPEAAVLALRRALQAQDENACPASRQESNDQALAILSELGDLYSRLQDFPNLQGLRTQVSERILRSDRCQKVGCPDKSSGTAKTLVKISMRAWDFTLAWAGFRDALRREPDSAHLALQDTVQRNIEALPPVGRQAAQAHFAQFLGDTETARRTMGEAAQEPLPTEAAQAIEAETVRQLEVACPDRALPFLAARICQGTVERLRMRARTLATVGAFQASRTLLSALRRYKGPPVYEAELRSWRLAVLQMELDEVDLHRASEIAPAVRAQQVHDLLKSGEDLLSNLTQQYAQLGAEQRRLTSFDSQETIEPVADVIEVLARLASQPLNADQMQSAGRLLLQYSQYGKARATQDLLAAQNSPLLYRTRRRALQIGLLSKVVSELGCGQTSEPAACSGEQLHLQQLQEAQLRDEQAGAELPGKREGAPSLSLKQTLSLLRPDELLLDYYVTPRSVVLIAVGSSLAGSNQPGFRVFSSAVKRSEVVARVARLQTMLLDQDRLVNAERDIDIISSWLLDGQLRAMDLTGVKTLLISPHADLHRLPWAILNNPFVRADRATRPQRFLVNAFDLQFLPFKDLLARRMTPLDREPANSSVSVVDTGELEWAGPEVDRILHFYRRSSREYRIGWTQLQRVLRRRGIVHIAGHGSASDRAGGRSAPTKSDTPAPAGYAILSLGMHGQVTALDILEMKEDILADLVVLADCWLGLGRISPGDEQVGISRALLMRGARGVIGAIWKLNETSSISKVFSSLHEHLARGESFAHALAQTQREMLATLVNSKPGDSQPIHPHFWAGLMVVTAD